MVRLKFRCNEITRRQGTAFRDGKYVPTEVGVVKLTPVTGETDENKAFYEATPGGSIEFATVNEQALAAFVLGGEYFIDLAPALAAG